MQLTTSNIFLLPWALNRKVIYPVLTFVLICHAASALAQISASASISLSARLPGSITLTAPAVPVTVAIHKDVQPEIVVPLNISWNLNPRETQSFEVVGHFGNPSAALTSVEGRSPIPARSLIVQGGDAGKERRLEPGKAAITLVSIAVTMRNRRGQYHQLVRFTIDEEILRTLPEGIYEGVLFLEVRQY